MNIRREDIPEDIWIRARRLNMKVRVQSVLTDQERLIAEALYEERLRCQRGAEETMRGDDGPDL